MATQITPELHDFENALANLRTLDEPTRDLLRAYFRRPNRPAWETVYTIALDPEGTMSLYRAVCMTSRFPSVIPVDENGQRLWPSLPHPTMITTALKFADA